MKMIVRGWIRHGVNHLRIWRWDQKQQCYKIYKWINFRTDISTKDKHRIFDELDYSLKECSWQ